MNKSKNAVKTMNFIRAKSSKQYQDVVPKAEMGNVALISDILLNDAYQVQLNEFVGNLINRIVLTIVNNKSFNNPLAMFKKGSTPLGTDIQEIYENPASAEQYEYTDSAMAKLLTITDPDTHVAYYRLNRKELYTKTITREGLQQAFSSWDKFDDYVSSITNSLYSGNYIDEFKYTKDLIDGAYDDDKVIVEKVSAVTDETTAKAFVKKCRTLFSKFKFPSTEYNAYSKFSGAKGLVTTWTDEDRICLLVRADVMTEVDVEVLARAFNMDSTKLMGRIIEVDKFENDEILGVICDEAWLQIYDNIFRFTEFYNARVMAWNQYLHAWNTFAISPFANAVVLATAKPIPATKIELDASSYSGAVGTDIPFTVTLTPSTSTTDVEFDSSDSAVFTVEKISNTSGNIIPVADGTAELQITSDNGLDDSAPVTIS